MLISGQIYTKFGTGVGVADEMTCDNFWQLVKVGQICGGGD